MEFATIKKTFRRIKILKRALKTYVLYLMVAFIKIINTRRIKIIFLVSTRLLSRLCIKEKKFSGLLKLNINCTEPSFAKLSFFFIVIFTKKESSLSVNLTNSNEINELLSDVQSSSAQGFSGIPTEIFKLPSSKLKTIIACLFNYLIISCTIPAEWKTAVVTPLYKNKGSAFFPRLQNYLKSYYTNNCSHILI
ncbi:hypothetical protein BpHYR1_039869 [Brachionus plicatilis]|uniref:RNA-directed DNA polymerase from mobile element jockey-like n=1 Tax=Brachionus plicatilis TaxID=10195 RepID=A0A3M7PEW7_BRAPC|nr:hypothetical protein BpHYR1_039869 [Brachionus plicatilis]